MESKEPEMTPEERVQWLRERGVLIETAEERRAKEVAEIMKEPDDGPTERISYVMIPHDRSKALQDLQVSVPLHQTGDVLAQHLKSAFGGNDESVDLSLLQEQAAQQLGSAGAPSKVSEETLKKVAKQGHVEVFSLVHAAPSNSFTAVNIYLDEVGMLKRLPLNTRASDYAAVAGYNPPPQFYGDVFLGRLKLQPTLQNKSIKVGKDTAMDAPWLQKATMENLEYQTRMNSITGKNETQGAVDGEGGVAKSENGYSWTQTEEELEVTVALPAGTTSKDVKIRFLPDLMKVQCRSQELLALKLFERVDPDGCTWTMENKKGDEKELVVTLEKVEQALWPRMND